MASTHYEQAMVLRPGGETDVSQMTRRHWGPQQTHHASEGTDLNMTGTDMSQKPPGKVGAQGPEMPAVKFGAQRHPSPTNTSPGGQSMQIGNPRVWPADVLCLASAVFVKNMTELPTFKN